MAKPDWGEKHLCTSCGARFYDMKQIPVSCPACGTKPKVPSSISANIGTQTRPKPKATDTATADAEDPMVDDGMNEEKENITEVLEVNVAQKDQP